jgi:hypothetical protein
MLLLLFNSDLRSNGLMSHHRAVALYFTTQAI